MKAWQLVSFGDHRLVETPAPRVVPGHVLIKVTVVQPSVTDTEVIMGTAFSSRSAKWLSEGKRLQLGHEYCGRVVELGEGVTSLKVGDRVCSATSNVYCGSCRMCVSGRHSQCLAPNHIGGDIPGAFAEFMCLPERAVARVPDGPTDNEVAAFQPLAASVASVHSAEIKMGDSVLVLGQGSIGLGVLQVAKLSGAGLLIAVAKRPESLALSKRYGADFTIDATRTDVVAEVKRQTEGAGVDIAFDTAGGNPKHGLSGLETLRQAFQSVSPRGKVIQSAILSDTIELDSVLMKSKKVRYIFPEANGVEYLRLAALWVASGRLQVSPQIKHILHGLEKLGEAIEMTENKAKYGITNPVQVVV